MRDEPAGPLPARTDPERSPQAPVRRFAAHEVARILERATSVEISGGLPAPHDPTLDDLVVAAREAGIDPAAVRRAASVVVLGGGGAGAALTGGPDRQSARGRGTGSPPAGREVADLVEGALGIAGRVEEGAEGVSWRSTRGTTRTRVAVRADLGGTEIVAESDQAGLYFWSWLTAAAGWAGLSPLLGVGGLGAGAWILSMLIVPLLVVRPFWSRATRAQRERLERLVMELARAADESGGGSGGESAGTPGG